MRHPYLTEAVVSLSIAGIGVSIRCDEPAVVAGLQARFHAFPPEASAQLAIRVMLAGSQRSVPNLDVEAVFDAGVLRFIDPGYTGWIDVERGQAELTLGSAYPVAEIEYFVRSAYALLAFAAGGLLFHAAGIVRNDLAYLFFGYSGSGKTTVARLSPRDRLLNDDLVLLLPAGKRWLAYATPFSNPTQVPPTGPYSAPVTALLRLVQNRTVFLEPMGSGQALAEIVASVPVLSTDLSSSRALLARALHLMQATPPQRLHFLPDDSFWPVVEALAVPQHRS